MTKIGLKKLEFAPFRKLNIFQRDIFMWKDPKEIVFDDGMAVELVTNTQFYDSFYNKYMIQFLCPMKCRLGFFKVYLFLYQYNR